MLETNCPKRDAWRDFMSGKSVPGVQMLESHLEECEACQQIVETLDFGEDSLGQELSQMAEPTANLDPDDTEFQGIRSTLQGIGSRSANVNHATMVDETVLYSNGEHPSPAIPGADNQHGAVTRIERIAGTIRDYELFEKLGEGGMGAVFRARHRRLDRLVAVKVLSQQVSQQGDASDRFEREMAAIGRLSHPHVVTAHDAGVHEGHQFLVMEYIEGVDLAEKVRAEGPLNVTTAVDYVSQAARGLAYIHQQGLIHRDVKPGNLLCDLSGTIKLLDLGLARFAAEEQSRLDTQTGLTAVGDVMGTAEFMAPEQSLDSRRADERSDIYGLGGTLFYLLTGRSMYAGDTLVKRILAHRDEPIPQLGASAPQLTPAESHGLQRLFEKMVAKQPGDRFQSMTEVIAACENLQQSLANPEVLPTVIEKGNSETLRRPTARSRKVAPLLLGGAVLCAVLLWAAMSFFIRTQYGVIRVDVQGAAADEVEVRVKGEHVTLLGVKDKPVELKPGKKTLQVSAAGLNFQTEELELKGKDDLTVTVKFLPGEIRVVRNDTGAVIGRNPRQPQTDDPTKPGKPSGEAAVPDVSYALEFDGKDDYVEIPNPQAWQDGPLTIEAWVTARQQGPTLSAVLEVAGLKLRMFRAGFQWMGIAYGPNEETVLVADPSPIPVKMRELDVPIHLAVVNDQQSLRLYVNGRFRGVAGFPANFEVKKPNKQGVIGRDHRDNADAYFHGLIDEVRITQAELYRENFLPPRRLKVEKKTLALYHCDSGRGEVLKDASGNGHHGKIFGAKWLREKQLTAAVDREAALYVLSVQGLVTVNEEPNYIKDAANLPRSPFRLTRADFFRNRTFKNDDPGLALTGQCQHLTHLNFSSTFLDDQGIANFEKTNSLIAVSVGFTRVTDKGLKFLAGNQNLKSLDLGRLKITAAGLAVLENFPNLTSLILGGSTIQDDALKSLQHCPRLKSLNLYGTEISDASLPELLRLKELTELNVVKTSLTKTAIDKLAEALPNCQVTYDGGVLAPRNASAEDRQAAIYVLSNGGTVGVNGVRQPLFTVDELPVEDFRLTTVSIQPTEKVTDDGLQVFSGCRNLETLELRACPVTALGLKHFQNNTGISNLQLRGLDVGDAGLQVFAHLKNLQTLIIHDRLITDAGVKSLDVAEVRNLSLAGCHLLTPLGYQHFQKCHHLSWV